MKLTEAQYKILADRMIEEHRKYGDRLAPGRWADLAARKIIRQLEDFHMDERVSKDVLSVADEIGENEHHDPWLIARVAAWEKTPPTMDRQHDDAQPVPLR